MKEGDTPTALAVEAALDDDIHDLYEHAPTGYLSALPDGTLVRVNETLLRWTGYAREQLLGKRFQDLLPAGARIFHETHYAPLLRMQGQVRELAVDLLCEDGRLLPVLINSVMKTDDRGEPLVVRTTVFDATERRGYERELLRQRELARESEARARELARTLQASLIPPAPPQIPGVDVAAVYRPAGKGDEVGGDFYDVFEAAPGEWIIVVGDVEGKGVKAATVTALARYTLRANALRTREPRRALLALNTALLRQEVDRLCSVVYACVQLDDGTPTTFTVASGGHPLPLYAPAGGRATTIGTPGTILGAIDGPPIENAEVRLQPGDAIVFFTDGCTEGRGPDGFFGEERIEQLVTDLRDGTASQIAAALLEACLRFQDGKTADDIALVVLKVPGAAQP